MAASEPWITLGTSREQCATACSDPHHLVYVAHDKGRPTGLIVLHPSGVAGSPYIKSICVMPGARSNGIGQEMIAFAEDLFRPNFKHIFLCVSRFNTRARQLYEKLDYKQVGEFHDYILPGESELLMHKRLK